MLFPLKTYATLNTLNLHNPVAVDCSQNFSQLALIYVNYAVLVGSANLHNLPSGMAGKQALGNEIKCESEMRFVGQRGAS